MPLFKWIEWALKGVFGQETDWVDSFMQTLPWVLMFLAMLVWAWIWGGNIAEDSNRDYGPTPELHYHYYPVRNSIAWKH